MKLAGARNDIIVLGYPPAFPKAREADPLGGISLNKHLAWPSAPPGMCTTPDAVDIARVQSAYEFNFRHFRNCRASAFAGLGSSPRADRPLLGAAHGATNNMPSLGAVGPPPLVR